MSERGSPIRKKARKEAEQTPHSAKGRLKAWSRSLVETCKAVAHGGHEERDTDKPKRGKDQPSVPAPSPPDNVPPDASTFGDRDDCVSGAIQQHPAADASAPVTSTPPDSKADHGTEEPKKPKKPKTKKKPESKKDRKSKKGDKKEQAAADPSSLERHDRRPHRKKHGNVLSKMNPFPHHREHEDAPDAAQEPQPDRERSSVRFSADDPSDSAPPASCDPKMVGPETGASSVSPPPQSAPSDEPSPNGTPSEGPATESVASDGTPPNAASSDEPPANAVPSDEPPANSAPSDEPASDARAATVPVVPSVLFSEDLEPPAESADASDPRHSSQPVDDTRPEEPRAKAGALTLPTPTTQDPLSVLPSSKPETS